MSDLNQAADEEYDQRQFLDAARGGPRYGAVERASLRPVELWRPWTHDDQRSQRWRRRVRLAQLVDSPYARPVIAADWEATPPQVVLEGFGGESLRERIGRSGAPNFHELAAWLQGVVLALANAHRLGLAHGHLSLDSIRIENSPAANSPRGRLDFHFLPLDADDATSVPSDDLLRLGEVWIEALGGPAELTRSAPAEFALLVERLLALDPLDRPAAPIVLAALDLWIAAGPRIDLAGTYVFESQVAVAGGGEAVSTNEARDFLPSRGGCRVESFARGGFGRRALGAAPASDRHRGRVQRSAGGALSRAAFAGRNFAGRASLGRAVTERSTAGTLDLPAPGLKRYARRTLWAEERWHISSRVASTGRAASWGVGSKNRFAVGEEP